MNHKNLTSYVAVFFIVFLLSVGFSFAYDGFALYESDYDSTIYLYDGFGNYVNYISTLDLVNEDCNDIDGIFDIDGSTGDLYILSSCGKLTKMTTDKTVEWTYQIADNDTKERYLKSNNNHVLITDTDNFTLLNEDGTHNVTRTNNYTVFSSNVELNKDSNILIADRNIDTIIELNIISDSFERIYSPYFINDIYSLSYDPVNETVLILHGSVGSGTYAGGDDYVDWGYIRITLIDNNFTTIWSFDDSDDNIVTNYDYTESAYFHCDTGGVLTEPYSLRSVSYDEKHYVLGGGELTGNSFCEDGFGNTRTRDGSFFLSTFDRYIEYPLDVNTAESHYISDYTDFATKLIDSSRDSSSDGHDDTFLVLDVGTSVHQLVALKEGDETNVTVGYQTGYTSYQSVKEFETPYPVYSKDNIRIAKVNNIAGLEEDDDVIGSDVSIVSNIPDQFTSIDTITLNMSEYFFNYTNIDIGFFNSDTSWIVTLDKNIADSDEYYNDSAVNYSLETSGSDLLFKIDPYQYYEGTHLSEEITVQAYRNDSADFAEQRFNLLIGRDSAVPEVTGDDVEIIGVPQNIKVPYETTATLNLDGIFRNANLYTVIWFDKDTGTTRSLSDTYTISSPFTTTEFNAWFGSDSLGRRTFYLESKNTDYVTSFEVVGVNFDTGFGIIDEKLVDFKYTIDNATVIDSGSGKAENIMDYIIPDSQEYDREGRWLWAIAIIVFMTAIFYMMTEGNITLSLLGAIIGFVASIAFGFIPVVVLVFVVIVILGFIFLRLRG